MPPGNLRLTAERSGDRSLRDMPPRREASPDASANLRGYLRSDLGKRNLPAAGGRGREGSVSAAAPLAGRRVSRPGKGIRGKAASLPTRRSRLLSADAPEYHRAVLRLRVKRIFFHIQSTSRKRKPPRIKPPRSATIHVAIPPIPTLSGFRKK